MEDAGEGLEKKKKFRKNDPLKHVGKSVEVL